jgi:hypothetical protein
MVSAERLRLVEADTWEYPWLAAWDLAFHAAAGQQMGAAR